MEQKPKKWPSKYGTRYEKAIRLTFVEGEKLDAILAQFECANLSQFCKKIIKGEIFVSKTK